MPPFNKHDHFSYLTIGMSKLIHLEGQRMIAKEGYGFPPSCIGILCQLWCADGINQKELAVSTFNSKSTINKMLLALEEDKLIIRKDDTKDRRNKRIHLTQRGRDFQKIIERGNKNRDKKLESEFSKAQIETAKKVLLRLMEKSSEELGPHIKLP